MTAKKLYTAIYAYKLYLHTLSSMLWTKSYYNSWFAGVRYVRCHNTRRYSTTDIDIPDTPFTRCYFLSSCEFKGSAAMSPMSPAPFVNSMRRHQQAACSLTNIYNEAE